MTVYALIWDEELGTWTIASMTAADADARGLDWFPTLAAADEERRRRERPS